MITHIVGIFGSRSLDDDRVTAIIADAIDRAKPDAVSTAGEPIGVCELARRYCKEHAIPLVLYHIDPGRCGGMYHHRSLALFEHVTSMIFIHDGVSRGTANELQLCEQMNIPYEYYTLQPIERHTPWDGLQRIQLPVFNIETKQP